MPSDTATTSEKVTSKHDRNSANNNTTETSSNSSYLSFPLLPLPPQEHHYRDKNLHKTMPTEDKMGTLYNAITAAKQQPVQSSSSSQRDRTPEHRITSNQGCAVRFVPRTTHLENRKRKMEEAVEHPLTGLTGKNEPLIGPKLPEEPKLDMEDESLNTTVSLIRNTMQQVASVPDLKPAEKKMKPRRRI